MSNNLIIGGRIYSNVTGIKASDGTDLVTFTSGGGSITISSETNSTGITCIITTSSTSSDITWETIWDNTINYFYENNGDYPYCWISSLASIEIPVGSIWRLTYNNESYVVTAAVNSTDGNVYIGNPKWAMGTDDGSNVPLCFTNPSNLDAWTGELNVENTQASYYIKIERQVMV